MTQPDFPPDDLSAHDLPDLDFALSEEPSPHADFARPQTTTTVLPPCRAQAQSRSLAGPAVATDWQLLLGELGESLDGLAPIGTAAPAR